MKYIHIARRHSPAYCSKCGTRMHSKDTYTHKANHSILQNNTCLYLLVNQRNRKCTNCFDYMNDSFSFIQRYCYCTNLMPPVILNALTIFHPY